VRTTLAPHALLDALQKIENDLGRKRAIEKGPRNIDLDIVLYDDQVIADHRLLVPHKLMLEREFVLRPLADLIPDERLPYPHSSRTIVGHLSALDDKTTDPKSSTVTPLTSDSLSLTASVPGRRTLLMAILNLTPDSFSDGYLRTTDDDICLESTIECFLACTPSIIDVGGQSTRPNASRISADEELARVLPAIKMIREVAKDRKVAISIDTFYAQVAKAAIEAGADIVNDVSAGRLDPEMLSTVAKLRKTLIMMHMRGDPSTMGRMTDYPNGVVHGVGEELLDRVKAAQAAGIPRWRIILDPGIGFAKTQAQNLELLRSFENLRSFPGLEGLPWLVGPSRKGFIGKITGVAEPRRRIWGTAAAVTAAIHGGAEMVRVHDIEQMQAVVRMADAIYRGEQ
jgi:2-amino-4-hydroxy-6-hydroxymethyldihydropteridine diphosphokinase / dihydropteroate synthase